VLLGFSALATAAEALLPHNPALFLLPFLQAYGYNIPQVTSTNGPFAAAASTKGLRGVMPSVSNGALGASTPSPGKPGGYFGLLQ
jgi:hypothetical protein